MTRKNRTTVDVDPSRVVGYIRVSTDEQALGPEAQRVALERWCQTQGMELVAFHLDIGISGGAPLDKRLGFLAALDSLKASGAGVLLVAKRDRLARDVVLAAMAERLVERLGARVISAAGEGNGEGPEAMLMRGMIDLFAQYERAIIRSRTKAALAVKKTRGERVGQIPYGYRLAVDGIRLESDPEEAPIRDHILHLRSQGLSYRRISRQLNDDGYRARGSRWHPTTVVRILAEAS